MPIMPPPLRRNQPDLEYKTVIHYGMLGLIIHVDFTHKYPYWFVARDTDFSGWCKLSELCIVSDDDKIIEPKDYSGNHNW